MSIPLKRAEPVQTKLPYAPSSLELKSVRMLSTEMKSRNKSSRSQVYPQNALPYHVDVESSLVSTAADCNRQQPLVEMYK